MAGMTPTGEIEHMNKQNTTRVLLAIVLLITLPLGAGLSSDKAEYRTAANTKPDGTRHRIGYLEGGPYFEYQLTLRAVINSLVRLGWLDEIEPPLPDDPNDTRELWGWLAENVKGRYIEFVKDGYWSDNWDDVTRKATKSKILGRLKERRDIDLMIAMGTWAGQDLANNQHSVPTLVFAATDPLRAKIIKDFEDSGHDHVHVRVDPTRYQRQIRLFHDLIGFRKLGIAYEDTEAGRSYAALEDVEKVAEERGFELVRCHSLAHVPDLGKASASLVECHRVLAVQIDAMYLTIQRGMNLKNLPRLMAPLNRFRIPTFSQFGSEEVKYGVLLSVAQAGFKYVGEFHGETIAKVLNGARPNELIQTFEDPSKIAINLEEARIIGWNPPVDVLSIADEVFDDIQVVDGPLPPK
jgi:ABC-type uncharacterized transport system substrate-binding protein